MWDQSYQFWPRCKSTEGVFGNCLTIDVLIEGVKTRCGLDTVSEVITISEAHFKKQFEGKRFSPAKWVKLTAANGLDIPVIGCLYAKIECLGRKLHGKCVFVLRDDTINMEERSSVPGILGMTVLGELHSLFAGMEGVPVVDQHEQHIGSSSLCRIFAGGKMGYVKVAG